MASRIGLTGRLVLVRGGNVSAALANVNRVMRNTGLEQQVGMTNYRTIILLHIDLISTCLNYWRMFIYR